MPQTISRKKNALSNSKNRECAEKKKKKKDLKEGEYLKQSISRKWDTLNKLKENGVCNLESKTPKEKNKNQRTWSTKKKKKTSKRNPKWGVTRIMNLMKRRYTSV